MAANSKELLIEALNSTPDGIDAFLETGIPALLTIGEPTTVDAAIIAQGQLAYNLNLVLKAFEGLTPIELLLRIGQHNSVLQGALLAGLELVSGERAEFDFYFVFPSSGGVYQPGDFTFVVDVVKGFEAVVAINCFVFQGDEQKATIDMSPMPDTTRYSGLYATVNPGYFTVKVMIEFDVPDGQPYHVEKSADLDVRAI